MRIEENHVLHHARLLHSDFQLQVFPHVDILGLDLDDICLLWLPLPLYPHLPHLTCLGNNWSINRNIALLKKSQDRDNFYLPCRGPYSFLFLFQMGLYMVRICDDSL